MTSRTFALWVEPIAAKNAAAAQEIVETAGSIPAEAWDQPSPLAGWSYKDVLAHVASNDDLRYLLTCVIAREWADPARFVIGGAAELNAREVAERRDRTVQDLISEFEAQESETQDLLAQLSDADSDYKQEDIPWSLGLALSAAEAGFHYKQHLEQLRAAL